MMQRLRCIAVLIFVSTSLLAQDDLTMSYFHGGDFKIRFGLSSSLLSGIGARNSGLGGVITGFHGDVSSTIHHPAALATFTRPAMIVDMTPSMMFSPYTFADIDAEVESGVDSALVDYAIPQEKLSYPGLNIAFGQSGFSGSGGLVIPTNYGQIGFAVYRPLSLKLDVVGSGFSTMIETSKAIGDAVTVVQFATTMSSSIEFYLDTRATSFTFARALTPKYSVGASLDWFDSHIKLDANFDLEGIMLLRQEGAVSGQEYVFNDPYDESIRTEDGEQNNLNQWANGGFDGSGWGFKLSSIYLPTRWISVDAVFTLPQELNLKGQFEFVQNSMPALIAENLFSDNDDDEIFDVTELSLAKPTATEQFINPSADHMTLKMPGSLVLGTSLRLGDRSLLAFNFTQYFGELSYSYLNYQQGIKFKQGMRFGASFPFAWYLSPETALLKFLGIKPLPRLRLGGGFILADEIKSGFSYQDLESDRTYSRSGLIIPAFSLGKSFTIIPRVVADVLIFSIPTSIFKMSFHYQF
ncbi:MAG: hypothetical protein DWQ05_02720 [Calditrichaeota bacterium]|nr:MAG: hypothetical protein DWQ05_02720 [Calditrichota bacterium]